MYHQEIKYSPHPNLLLPPERIRRRCPLPPGLPLGDRGSTLVAALALVFLIFAITTVSLTRVASSLAITSARHNAARALMLADAGVQKAAHRLCLDKIYSGEKGTRLPAGTFDINVERGAKGYIVTSVGHPSSAVKSPLHRTVRAVVIITSSRSFRIED